MRKMVKVNYKESIKSDNDFKYPSHHDTNNENTHAQEKR